MWNSFVNLQDALFNHKDVLQTFRCEIDEYSLYQFTQIELFDFQYVTFQHIYEKPPYVFATPELEAGSDGEIALWIEVIIPDVIIIPYVIAIV